MYLLFQMSITNGLIFCSHKISGDIQCFDSTVLCFFIATNSSQIGVLCKQAVLRGVLAGLCTAGDVIHREIKDFSPVSNQDVFEVHC